MAATFQAKLRLYLKENGKDFDEELKKVVHTGFDNEEKGTDYSLPHSQTAEEMSVHPKEHGVPCLALRQHEQGKAFILIWQIEGLAKPTKEQLDSYEAEAQKNDDNAVIRNTRKDSYMADVGIWEEQLDLLYKDMAAGKGDSTGEWFKKIKAIKDANPKVS